jgi:hypothetical protein
VAGAVVQLAGCAALLLLDSSTPVWVLVPRRRGHRHPPGLIGLANHVTVPRGHTEILQDSGSADGAGETVSVKLGVWISNTKSRRAKLTPDKLAALAELGLNWA